MGKTSCNDCEYNDNGLCDKFGVLIDEDDCCEDIKKILNYSLTYGYRSIIINVGNDK